jgi:multicomponent Na+:H+ antiporter subunit E
MFVTLIEHRVTHLAAALGLWWVLSGHGDWLMLSLGLGSSLFTVYLASRMLAIDQEAHRFVINRDLVTYWGWLARAIISSNLYVARHVVSVPLQISPTLIRLRTGPKTEVGMATLANSITLTPGTVSLDVDVESRAIAVHALTREVADHLQTGEMERRARDPGREARDAW